MKRIYLENCRDYEMLKSNLSNEQLDFFEATIKNYEESNNKTSILDIESSSDILGWYEGLIDTNCFISDWVDC